MRAVISAPTDGRATNVASPDDVERLPAGDVALDLVYVHDGLHHLEHPEKGIAEMARVGRSVSVTEPARAAGTQLAVKLGLALHKEESGNVVMRLRPGEISAQLQGVGFRTLALGRYLMYYRHEPGRVFGLLSRRGLFLLAGRHGASATRCSVDSETR